MHDHNLMSILSSQPPGPALTLNFNTHPLNIFIRSGVRLAAIGQPQCKGTIPREQGGIQGSRRFSCRIVKTFFIVNLKLLSQNAQNAMIVITIIFLEPS